MIRIIALLLCAFSLSGCATVGFAAWAHHDYDYHCYGPNPPASWCRDHR